MPAEIKFCGLTRSEDTAHAVRLGARYVGVIFADGPRLVDPRCARGVLAPVREGVDAVGVFGRSEPVRIAEMAAESGVRVAQLHADPRAADVTAVRRRFGGQVWAVIRVADALPDDFASLAAEADGVVIDSRVASRLGGSGIRFDWEEVARQLDSRRPTRLVVAGGLTPENVAQAVAALAPDVVDVSSGVESAPGIKDHARMCAFVEAVRGHEAGA